MATAAASAAGGGKLKWILLGIEAGVLLLAAVALAGALALSSDFRDWLTALLGHGWALLGYGMPIVGGYAGVTLGLLVHRPGALWRGWRWWLAGWIAVVIAIAGLSLGEGSSGPLYTYGLAGKVGYGLTGGYVAMAAGIAGGGLLLGALLVVPGAHRWYGLAIKYAAVGLWRGLRLAGIGLGKAARGIWRLLMATGRGIGRLAGRRRGKVASAAASGKARAAAAEAAVGRGAGGYGGVGGAGGVVAAGARRVAAATGGYSGAGGGASGGRRGYCADVGRNPGGAFRVWRLCGY